MGEITHEDAGTQQEKDEPRITQLPNDGWAVYGNVQLQQLEEALGVDIVQDDVGTLSGLVFSQLDMIPHDGEQDIQLELAGLHIHITKVEDHRIAYAEITKLPAVEEKPKDED